MTLTKTVELEEYQSRYLLKLLDKRWSDIDKEREGYPHRSETYRQMLAEQSRIERLQELLK